VEDEEEVCGGGTEGLVMVSMLAIERWLVDPGDWLEGLMDPVPRGPCSMQLYDGRYRSL